MKIVAVEAIHLRIEDANIGLFDGSYDDCLIVVTANDSESLGMPGHEFLDGLSGKLFLRALVRREMIPARRAAHEELACRQNRSDGSDALRGRKPPKPGRFLGIDFRIIGEWQGLDH